MTSCCLHQSCAAILNAHQHQHKQQCASRLLSFSLHSQQTQNKQHTACLLSSSLFVFVCLLLSSFFCVLFSLHSQQQHSHQTQATHSHCPVCPLVLLDST